MAATTDYNDVGQEEELDDATRVVLLEQQKDSLVAGLVPEIKDGEIVIPTQAQNFEIGECLGKGTFAEVYIARNKTSGKLVALKASVFDGKSSVAREIAGMRLIGKHKYCVGLRSFFPMDNLSVLEVDLVEGGTDLFQHLEMASLSGELSEFFAQQIFHGITLGLAHCHSRGVVHRDIKPENVLVRRSTTDPNVLRVKLIDFGLCDFFDPSLPELKTCTTFVGSIDFSAPEVVKCALEDGKPQLYDGMAADMWPVGVILFESLYWKYPFHRDLRIASVQSGTPQAPLEFPVRSPDCTLEFKDLCSALVEEDPAVRLSAAAAMAHPWANMVFSA